MGLGREIASVTVRARVTGQGAIVPVPEAIEASVRPLPTAAKAAVTVPRRPIVAPGPRGQSGAGATVRSATYRPARQPACNQHEVRQASVDGAATLRAAALPAAVEAEVVGVAAVAAGAPILR
jgi:hypothetical protein